MEAIERLLARTGDRGSDHSLLSCVRRPGLEALGELWTEDATFVAAGISFEGRKTLLDFLTLVPAGRLRRPRISAPGR